MNVDTGSFMRLTEQVARLADEVTRLTKIREGLDRYTANQASAHYLTEMGRQLERDAQASRTSRPGPRWPRPGYLRSVDGGAK